MLNFFPDLTSLTRPGEQHLKQTKYENNNCPCSWCHLITGYAFVTSGFAFQACLTWRIHWNCDSGDYVEANHFQHA